MVTHQISYEEFGDSEACNLSDQVVYQTTVELQKFFVERKLEFFQQVQVT